MLRADAQRNRENVIQAARDVFAERGLVAPLEEVARRAGVGVGTLYRRFPTRQDLIGCAFERRILEYGERSTTDSPPPDPWMGFCGFVERICAMQATDRGFADVLTLTFPTQKQLEAERARNYHAAVELLQRAKATGELRPEFVPRNLVMLLMANAVVVNASAQDAPQVWRRLVAYLLQAFAVHDQPLPDAPNPQDVERAMLRIHADE